MGECLIIRSGSGIDTTNANATSESIVIGYTCYVDDECIAGNIPIQKLSASKLGPSELYRVGYGYYNGVDQLTTDSLDKETVATASNSDIISNHNGWANGALVSGKMTSYEGSSIILPVNGTYTIPTGWYHNSIINQALATKPATSITPSTTDIVVCTSNSWTTGDIVIVGDANLIAGNIKNGAEIYGVKGTAVGWVDTTMPVSTVASQTAYNTSMFSSTTGSLTCWRWSPIPYQKAYEISKIFTKVRFSAVFWLWSGSTSGSSSKYSKGYWWACWVNSAGQTLSTSNDYWDQGPSGYTWTATADLSTVYSGEYYFQYIYYYIVNGYGGGRGQMKSASAPYFHN